ncbi:hypothetical protein [Shigella sonnei]|uniref:hypothetical protein n=1 Tax=Shigella sonnei TaxID=624 RepID=UPI00391837B7
MLNLEFLFLLQSLREQGYLTHGSLFPFSILAPALRILGLFILKHQRQALAFYESCHVPGVRACCLLVHEVFLSVLECAVLVCHLRCVIISPYARIFSTVFKPPVFCRLTL